ncbi:3'-5' exonuclease [Pseudomonas qingdaonensis]|uniref:3'-5' exonuclease n=1 Tax=Pseudomonas qingdaonensis TaxID=2056231 RepID=UPI00265D62E8|nr:3'-5' exonuclease [Pseudomonas qingdaonensis]WKL67235.1 3'-5' exonuclease [Pseudomonas qingdaonensis]
MKPTHEQQPIIDYKGLHLVVKAYAGCGKTATLVAFAQSNPNLRILYLAYNKAIKDEALTKFPDNVTCKTGHQLAWPKFGSRYAHKLGNTKMTDVARLLNTKDWGFVRNTMAVVSSYMSSADAEIGIAHFYAGVPAEDQDAFSDSDIEKLLNAAQTLWEEMTDIESSFICEHDAYLKLYQLSGPELSYDCILFDEAQDANPVVSAIVASQPGQKIFVGDPWQQIYRWRGAENALDQQIEQGAEPMYLTNSFRFGPMIAGVANAILRLQGETRPLVGLGPMDKVKTSIEGIRGQYTILNRTVSGVIMSAIEAVSNGHVVYWNGGIGAYNLEGLEDTYNLKNNRMGEIRDFRVKAFKSYDAYTEAAEASEDPEMLRTMRILKDHGNIPQLLAALRQYSTDDIEDADIVVSTTHRAKGLEWDIVLLDEDFPDIFDPERVDPDQVGDELNLLYVGVTRARKILILNTLVQSIIVRAHRAAKLAQTKSTEPT